jgi:hypothetical protein
MSNGEKFVEDADECRIRGGHVVSPLGWCGDGVAGDPPERCTAEATRCSRD